MRSRSISSWSKSRCGSVTGTRVPMRITSTWSIAARLVQEERELGQRQRQRVAAGDDDVADLGVLADVLDHPLVVAADGVPAAAVHGAPLARAEPAVHGADVRRDQQRAVGVAVRQAGDGRVLVLFQRVFQFVARTGSQLPAARGPTAGGSGRAGSAGSMREK